MSDPVRQEVDEQIALVSRIRVLLAKAAEDVAVRLAKLDNPMAKVETMARLADIMARAARTAADLKRLTADAAGAEQSIEELLKEDL